MLGRVFEGIRRGLSPEPNRRPGDILTQDLAAREDRRHTEGGLRRDHDTAVGRPAREEREQLA